MNLLALQYILQAAGKAYWLLHKESCYAKIRIPETSVHYGAAGGGFSPLRHRRYIGRHRVLAGKRRLLPCLGRVPTYSRDRVRFLNT